MVQEIASSIPVSTNALVELNVLEIPLDKELTINCLVETHAKLRELILAEMVLCGLIRVPCPGLQQSLYVNVFGMVLLGPQGSVNTCKMC